MRRYRGIRFDLQSDLETAFKKVVYSRQETEEAKAAMREAGRLVQAYYRAYPEDRSKLEAFKALEEAHKKAELVRLLLIQAQNYVR